MNLFSDPAFTLYAMECEGDLDTHQGKLNRAVKFHKEQGYTAINYSLLVAAGLCPSTLSPSDLNYILSRL